MQKTEVIKSRNIKAQHFRFKKKKKIPENITNKVIGISAPKGK